MKYFSLPWTLVIVCFVLANFAGAAAPKVPQKAHPESSKWDDVFDADLSNTLVPEKEWSFKDGVLTANAYKALWTKKTFDNFTVDLEFKTTDSAFCGVIVYCNDTEDWLRNAIGIQIADDHSRKWAAAPKSWQCGAISGRLPAIKQKVVKKPGEWNRMTITCIDNKIYVILNGQQVNVMDMKKWTDPKRNPDGTEIPSWLSDKPIAELPTHGHIGLQGMYGDAPVYFRNLKVKEIKKEDVKKIKKKHKND